MLFFGQLDAEKGWTKQLHLGALRNTNTRMFEKLGRDVGCDSMDDPAQAAGLKFYLDTLEERGHLPKTVLYNNHPKDNYVFATIIGNYQSNEQGIAGLLEHSETACQPNGLPAAPLAVDAAAPLRSITPGVARALPRPTVEAVFLAGL